SPRTGILLGTVVDGAGQPVVDAAVSIRPAGGGSRREGVFNRSWTSGADGRFAVLEVPPGPVQVVARLPGLPDVVAEAVNGTAGEAARVTVTVPVTPELREAPYLAILRPGENAETSSPVVHILGRTMPGNTVTVGGSIVEVFSTGGFARDNIPLQPGENRIE